MTDERKAGIAFIAGALGGILTMAVHPVGSGSLTPAQVMHLMTASAAVHSLGMISVLLIFLGACGLARHLPGSDRMGFAALVTFGFACVGVFMSATVSGFIVPELMRHMMNDQASAAPQWKIAIDSIFQINQAFAKIYGVATSAAILLWSISALRNRGLGKTVAIYGCVIPPLIALGVIVGQLRMDVHGFGAIMLGQAIWFIAAGASLYKSTPPEAPVTNQ